MGSVIGNPYPGTFGPLPRLAVERTDIHRYLERTRQAAGGELANGRWLNRVYHLDSL